MHILGQIFICFSLCTIVGADSWPYKRYHGHLTESGHYKANKSKPEYEQDPPNLYGQWLHHLVNADSTGQLQKIFINGSIPHNATFDDILSSINIPEPDRKNGSTLPPHIPQPWPLEEAKDLFKHLNYSIDPTCTMDHSKW